MHTLSIKMRNTIAANATSTSLTNYQSQKVRDWYILLTVLLVIMLLVIIIFIWYYYAKKGINVVTIPNGKKQI